MPAKTIKELAQQFNNRFQFRPIMGLGCPGYRINDTHTSKSATVFGDNDAETTFAEMERACTKLLQREGNGRH